MAIAKKGKNVVSKKDLASKAKIAALAAKKEAKRLGKKKPGKKNLVIEDEVQAQGTQAVFVRFVKQTPAGERPDEMSYFGADGSVIPRSTVCAVVGKTIYHQVLQFVGSVQDTKLVKDVMVYKTEEGNVIALDPSSVLISTLGYSSPVAEDVSEDEEEEAPKKKGKKKAKAVVEEEDESDDEDEESDDEEEDEDDEEEDDEDDEEEDESDDEDEESDDEEEDEEEDESDDEDEDDEMNF